jgi:hypothetical protein
MPLQQGNNRYCTANTSKLERESPQSVKEAVDRRPQLLESRDVRGGEVPQALGSATPPPYPQRRRRRRALGGNIYTNQTPVVSLVIEEETSLGEKVRDISYV